jgi:hypothetical protein
LQDAETSQAGFVTLLHMLDRERHQIAQHRFCLLLRQIMTLIL